MYRTLILLLLALSLGGCHTQKASVNTNQPIGQLKKSWKVTLWIRPYADYASLLSLFDALVIPTSGTSSGNQLMEFNEIVISGVFRAFTDAELDRFEKELRATGKISQLQIIPIQE